MRDVLVLMLLTSCYSPTSSVTSCAVSCARSAPCPDDLVCGSDLLCHARGTDECSVVDSGVDAFAGPTLGADLVAWSPMDVEVARSTGAAFLAPASWYTTSVAFQGAYTNLICDVSGDGRADLVTWSFEGQEVAISTGTTFLAPTQWRAGFWNASIQLCGDTNGDGRDDLIGVATDDVTVSLSTGGAFASPVAWSNDPFAGTRGTFVAKLDADARADLISWKDDRVLIKRSNLGDTYSTGVVGYAGATFSAFANRAGDVDGDGLTDLVAWNAGNVLVQLMTPTGTEQFGQPQQWFSGSFTGSVANIVADVNADGRADLVAWDSNSVRVALSTGSQFAAAEIWLSAQLDGSVADGARNVDF
jgi:hypothetical protein